MMRLSEVHVNQSRRQESHQSVMDVIFEGYSIPKNTLTGSAVITHDVTTGTGYCLVGFNWIIDFLN